jgi:hypothetical protein
MWAPFRQSIEQWAPQCKLVYDKFHILQHANDAIDEVRKAEFFRQGKHKRGLIQGKKWLLMSRWKNLTVPQRVQWIDQLKWQRLTPFEELADMLLKHLEWILNYCRTKVRFGVVRSTQWKHACVRAFVDFGGHPALQVGHKRRNTLLTFIHRSGRSTFRNRWTGYFMTSLLQHSPFAFKPVAKGSGGNAVVGVITLNCLPPERHRASESVKDFQRLLQRVFLHARANCLLQDCVKIDEQTGAQHPINLVLARSELPISLFNADGS